MSTGFWRHRAGDDRDDDGQVARFGDSEHLTSVRAFAAKDGPPAEACVWTCGWSPTRGRPARRSTTPAPRCGHTIWVLRYDNFVAKGRERRHHLRKNVRGIGKRPTGCVRSCSSRRDRPIAPRSTPAPVGRQRPDSKRRIEDSSCGRRLPRAGAGRLLEYKISRRDDYPYAGIPAGEPYARPDGQPRPVRRRGDERSPALAAVDPPSTAAPSHARVRHPGAHRTRM